MLRTLRLLLYPFSLLFGVIVYVRNIWYARRAWVSPVPTVVVGNLTTGGTGKTPHAMMVAEILLQHGKHPVSLSRGYGRKTRGFLEVEPESAAWQAGDEPLMIRQRFPELPVFVCENRVEGIRKILGNGQRAAGNRRSIDCIVLDDAYQHRKLKPDFSVVLLTYDSLQKPWLLLPAGNGREPLSALNRSHAVIVTKCHPGMSIGEKQKIRDRLKKYTDSPVYFSSYRYLGFVNGKGQNILPNQARDKAVLLAGIADPKPLKEWLGNRFYQLGSILYSDHYVFSVAELKKVLSQAGTSYIVITEKDRVRIRDIWPEFLENERVLVVPIVPDLGEESPAFEKHLMDTLRHF